MTDYYILEGHEVKLVDRETRVAWLDKVKVKGERSGTFVAGSAMFVADEQFGDVRVSTLFTGAPGKLFDTLILGGKHDTLHWSCNTWDEAEAQHAKAVTLVKESQK